VNDRDYLFSAAAVRERCNIVFDAAERGETPHFRLIMGRLDEAARRVAEITRQRYPDLNVPYHSRWRHFAVGGIDRAALVAPAAEPAERARARIDLAVVSVLLDAGTGPEWHYREAESGAVLSRSEGLAVASLRAMQAGLFSGDSQRPWRADAERLCELTPAALARAFQHGPGNPLTGLEGRAQMLRRLGESIGRVPGLFGRPARPGNLYDHWWPQRDGLAAAELLSLLLHALAPVWPDRPLGDCGRHPAVPGDGLVPFHKLLQWLAYSLVEPLEEAGFRIIGIDGLTGLAEYRNGGLFLDCGVLEPRDPNLCRHRLEPMSEAVVEWRALTVALLDRLVEPVRARLGIGAEAFPLARLLEGGSWAAGRAIARECRPDGSPPLSILSDGTVF
jgi:hypothetical protein